jgi:hypothetical protein
MRLSNSSISTLSSCGQKFKYSYIDKLTSIWKGSALFFGSAMDASLNYMLLNKDKECLEDSKALFVQEWTSQKERSGKVTRLEQHEFMQYSDSDMDIELLVTEDLASLSELFGADWQNRFDGLKNKKKAGNEFETWNVDDRKFWNHVHWFSMLRKGFIMLETYYNYVLPEIEEVLDVQKHVELKADDKDSIQGYVDFVVRMKDGRVAVMDNKTSSIDYAEDSATFSPQLVLYKFLLNQSPEVKYEVTHTGYVVLSKKMEKNKTKECLSCGYVPEMGGTHKTCNNTVNGKRCGGEWKITLAPKCNYQIIISEPSQKFEEDLLTNINIQNMIIANGLYTRNFGSCMAYGRPCPYKTLCYENKLTDDLVKKE